MVQADSIDPLEHASKVSKAGTKAPGSKNFILNNWGDFLKLSNITIVDSKTKLQEYSLKLLKTLPIYKLINSTGPKHNPIYKIAVSIIGSKQFVGFGNSKQEAQLDGATKLLKAKNIK